MIRQTCSEEITRIYKHVLFGPLLSTKCFSLLKSVSSCSISVSLKILEIEDKYSFNLATISSDFVYRLLSKIISSGKPEFEHVFLLFTFRKCCHIVFISFDFVTISEK